MWMLIAIIVLIVIAFFVFTSKPKKTISGQFYNELFDMRKYGALLENAPKLYDMISPQDKFKFKSLIKDFEKQYNDFTVNSLSINLKPYIPMSTEKAAFIGTKVGGTAVGVAAALNAEKKQEQYKKDMQRYNETEAKKGSSIKETEEIFNRIESIICNNNTANEEWNTIKNNISKQLLQEYRIK